MNDRNDFLEDDEVFIGKITLREVRKHIHVDDERRSTWSSIPKFDNEISCDTSIKIIECHSEPDLLKKSETLTSPCTQPNLSETTTDPKTSKYQDINTSCVTCVSEDSFLKIEKLVTDLSDSPENKNVVLDNTTEIVNYVLKTCGQSKIHKDNQESSTCTESNTNINFVPNENEIQSNLAISPTCFSGNLATSNNNPLKPEQDEIFCTPIGKLKSMFKTPLPSHNKVSLKKTPHKTNSAYDHIKSPIASYIKNSPQVPLTKVVHPIKPLTGSSHIPRPLKNVPENKGFNNSNGKENGKVFLPQVAYRSAKKLEVIDTPETTKLPTQSTKKNLSSLPKPVILRHNHRVINPRRPLMPQQEDSFDGLSFHQADISICTRKPAFMHPQNNI